jgi:hypothetical protein
MPSCELPAMRMTASLMREIFFAPPADGAPVTVSLMELALKVINCAKEISR